MAGASGFTEMGFGFVRSLLVWHSPIQYIVTTFIFFLFSTTLATFDERHELDGSSSISINIYFTVARHDHWQKLFLLSRCQ